MTLMMRFGKEKNLAEDMERLQWKGRERRMSMVRRLVRHPITALEASWKGCVGLFNFITNEGINGCVFHCSACPGYGIIVQFMKQF